MPERADKFDMESVREDWDRAADAWAARQDAGGDFYRYEFFGPAQVAACGDVSGLRVLDVGCGGGYFSREMARRGARVVGQDRSAGMLAHAVRHERDVPLGVEYVACDAADVGERFAPESFDLAVSSDGTTVLVTTHYLDEAERCHRVALIHGGRLATIGTIAQSRSSWTTAQLPPWTRAGR